VSLPIAPLLVPRLQVPQHALGMRSIRFVHASVPRFTLHHKKWIEFLRGTVLQQSASACAKHLD
jgi:hypothetical protein